MNTLLMQAPTNMETWFVIANPMAGNGSVKKQWNKIHDLLKKHVINFEYAFTKDKGHAIELVREALQNGFRRIIAVGGDGTSNEVVNGIFQQKIAPVADILYTLIPVGTGNDWVKEYGISKNLTTCISQIPVGKIVQQDVGLATYFAAGEKQSRYFSNVAGMAYDAFVARYSEQYKNWVSNKIFYLFLIFRCLFMYRLTKAKITFDGEVVENVFHTINAGVCRFSGGGMQIVPHSVPNDGKLALTIAREVSKFGVLLATPLFYNGKIGTHPKITLHQTSLVRIEACGDGATLLEVDGEFLGETPVELSVAADSLRIVVPK